MRRLWIALFSILVVTLACGGVSAPSSPTLQPIWEKDNSIAPSSPVYYDGLFYVLSNTHQILAWDEMTGVIRWQVGADSFRLSREGNLIYALQGAGCRTLDPSNGQTLAQLPPNKTYLCDMSRSDDSKFNFKLNDDNTVSAVNAETGASLWVVPLSLPQSSIFAQPSNQSHTSGAGMSW